MGTLVLQPYRLARMARPGATLSSNCPFATTGTPPTMTCAMPSWRDSGIAIRGSIDDLHSIKNRDVGVSACAQAPLCPHRPHSILEMLRRHQRHLSYCVHQRQSARLLTYRPSTREYVPAVRG